MLTDLELVFLDYYCTLAGWDIGDRGLVGGILGVGGDGETGEEEQIVEMCVELNACFVKFYVGR